MNKNEEFIQTALAEESLMWDEKTLRKLVFALHDAPNAEALIDKFPSRGAVDCIRIYALLNFLILESIDKFPELSVSKLRRCSDRLRKADRTVATLVNLPMDEVNRRIQRFLKISREHLNVSSPDEMISCMNRVKQVEPELYSHQTYFSVYVMLLIESSEKEQSHPDVSTLVRILNYLLLAMIEMPE